MSKDITEEEQKLFNMVKMKSAELYEHFDSVQIFCTKHLGGSEGTSSVHYGAGDYFARYGIVKSWVRNQEKGDS